ncbi:TPA: hypothetical protein ACLFL5_003897, partial [Salmonella enterica subsp. houtenae serovar Houten]
NMDYANENMKNPAEGRVNLLTSLDSFCQMATNNITYEREPDKRDIVRHCRGYPPSLFSSVFSG